MWNICASCGRVFEALAEAAAEVAEYVRTYCRTCRERVRAGQQLIRSTFEERIRLKTARFKVAMGQTTDFPGETSFPERRVPGAAWYEARAILAEAYAELALPDLDEGEFA